MRVGRRVMGVVAGALAVTSAIATPAQATVREVVRDRDVPYGYEDTVCGLDVVVEGAFSEVVLVREGQRADDTLFYVVNHFSFSETWTDLDTGRSMTVSGRDVVVDRRGTRVSGSVFETHVVTAGQPLVIADSDGKVVARDRGSVRFHYLLDTGGDDVFGGTHVGPNVPEGDGGVHTTGARLCELATDLLA